MKLRIYILIVILLLLLLLLAVFIFYFYKKENTRIKIQASDNIKTSVVSSISSNPNSQSSENYIKQTNVSKEKSDRKVILKPNKTNNINKDTNKNIQSSSTEKSQKSRIGITDNGFNYFLNKGSSDRIEAHLSEEYSRNGRPSIVVNYYIYYPGWAAIYFTENETNMDWSEMNYLRIWCYGNNSSKWFFIELHDKDEELFVYPICDNWNGWKELVVPLDKFKVRTYQHPSTKKLNRKIDYPVKHVQFQVSSYGELPGSSGKFTLIINEIEVTKE